MPDDTVSEDLEERDDTEDGQHAQDLKPIEIPTDPTALTAFATEQARRAQEADSQVRKLQKKAETLEQDVREKDAKADYWARKAIESPKATPVPAKQPPASPSLKQTLAGMDLAEYVAADDGTEKLVKDLEERGVIITPAKLEQALDERDTRTQAKQTAFAQVGETYPEIAQKDSPLQKAAFEEFEKLKLERPTLDEATQIELAASRAAARVKTTMPAKPQPPNGDRERARRAQGAPAGNGGGGAAKLTLADITPADRKMARKVTGQSLTDAQILATKQRVADANRTHKAGR